MNQNIKTVLAVIRAILSYCTSAQWSSLVNSVPGFTSAILKMQDWEKQINELIVRQAADTKGFTRQRQLLRKNLAITSFVYLRRGMAYAKSKGNNTLYASLNISLSKLKGMGFTIIGQEVSECMDLLKAVPPADLVPFGITSLTEWQLSLKTYNDYVSLPRNKKADKKAAGAMLETVVRDASTYMRENLTPLAEAFIGTNPLFVIGYKANLKQIPAPVRHTRLNAVVTDELGTLHINCTVTVDKFIKDEKPYNAASAITGFDGSCIVKEFESGIRTVTVSGPTVATKTFGPFKFENGKSNVEVFVCEPAFVITPAAPVAMAKSSMKQ